MTRPLSTFFACLLSLMAFGAAAPAVANAHQPRLELGAAYFSVPTFYMCPGGSNRELCSLHGGYGTAHCKRIPGIIGRHSIACTRYASDKNIHFPGTKKAYDLVWRATGTVDHNYHVHNLRLAIVDFAIHK